MLSMKISSGIQRDSTGLYVDLSEVSIRIPEDFYRTSLRILKGFL